jgi:LemA protein
MIHYSHPPLAASIGQSIGLCFLFFLLLAIIVALLSALRWGFHVYDSLTDKHESVKAAWSNISIQFDHRRELIPQLESVVANHVGHESAIIRRIVRARQTAQNARRSDSIAKQAEAETHLTAALRGLYVSVEAYPQLQASRSFLDLQEQIRDVTQRISGARSGYDSAAQSYNSALRRVSGRFISSMFTFDEAPYFDGPGDRIPEPW